MERICSLSSTQRMVLRGRMGESFSAGEAGYFLRAWWVLVIEAPLMVRGVILAEPGRARREARLARFRAVENNRGSALLGAGGAAATRDAERVHAKQAFAP